METHSSAAACAQPAPQRRETHWIELLERIRQGDAEAAEQFLASYTRGARAFFRRHLGPVGLEPLVEQSMWGAVREIRTGLIRQPGDFIVFLRTILSQQQAPTNPGLGESEAGQAAHSTAVLGSTDKARIRRKAELLEVSLQGCTAREREMLERYYLRGEPLERVLREMGVASEEFHQLRSRLLDSVRRADPARHPGRAMARMFRRAAGGS